MWPEGGDPHAVDAQGRPNKKRQAPLCVFVEFDDIKLQSTDGRPLSFFPDDPERKNWVPIWRQKVASNETQDLSREQFPLQLAWALTHWKAQGMTLPKVRVHLSERTAKKPGIGFVAVTRVKHPWDLVFEEDLPDY